MFYQRSLFWAQMKHWQGNELRSGWTSGGVVWERCQSYMGQLPHYRSEKIKSHRGEIHFQKSHSSLVLEWRWERGCLDSRKSVFILSIHNAGNLYLEEAGAPKCVCVCIPVFGWVGERPCSVQDLKQIVVGKRSIPVFSILSFLRRKMKTTILPFSYPFGPEHFHFVSSHLAVLLEN